MNTSLNKKNLRSKKVIPQSRKAITSIGPFADHLKKELGDEAKVSVIYSSPYRAKPNEPFALFFYETCFNLLLKKVIGMNEMILMLYLLKSVTGDNLVLSLSKAKIAKDLGFSRSKVSRSWKRLAGEKIILVNENDHVFINPHLISRSALAKMRETQTYRLAADERYKFQSANPSKEFGLPVGF